MMDLYWTGMFIRINKTIETKYMPIIWLRNRTRKFELLGLDIQMKNLDMVKSRPRVEAPIMAPTRPNEICWDQNRTSISKPNQCTAISIPEKIRKFSSKWKDFRTLWFECKQNFTNFYCEKFSSKWKEIYTSWLECKQSFTDFFGEKFSSKWKEFWTVQLSRVLSFEFSRFYLWWLDLLFRLDQRQCWQY